MDCILIVIFQANLEDEMTRVYSKSDWILMLTVFFLACIAFLC